MSNKLGLELVIEAERDIAASHPHIHFVMSGDGPSKAELSPFCLQT
jgi:colanic acid biosynthesis glycosyl transferase WcaI